MKKNLLLMLILLLPVWPVQAGKIVTDSLRSEILNATVKYNVYLPDGFSEGTDRYPAVYLLHGLYGTYKDWSKQGGMKTVTDELMGTGEACKMVIFMPNAGHPGVERLFQHAGLVVRRLFLPGIYPGGGGQIPLHRG